ncbi:uncharacterized protein E0L32_011736 [Thyridium curvatum]|uniref:Uncharacterized protein n=1 Tax=Thyridium curvatum TaxID=1093900 RepID=A0A507BMD5_9PEZI|nr:uncharacterized protein E0L32_011736 [Thyridium curvatum]TPX18361.1 hypothetical protein E0L32_011736 [Thyridium curvatum]
MEFGEPAAANQARALNGNSVPKSSRAFKLNWASGGGLIDRRDDRGPEFSIFVDDLGLGKFEKGLPSTVFSTDKSGSTQPFSVAVAATKPAPQRNDQTHPAADSVEKGPAGKKPPAGQIMSLPRAAAQASPHYRPSSGPLWQLQIWIQPA